jgi:predicted permease
MLADLRYAVRMLRKRPGTSALAIFALALGIGLTTTMFSIVQGAFLRGLPFDEADRLLSVGTRQTSSPNPQETTLHDFTDWRARQHTFEELVAMSRPRVTLASEADGAARYDAEMVTPNLLKMLRVRPVAGRDFTDADGRPGAPRVLIIGYAAWQSQFHADPGIVGRVVRLDSEPATIVGVAPPKFGFPETAQVWYPLDLTLPAKRGDGTRVSVVGRLAPGVSIAQANADLAGIASQLAAQYPENKNTTAMVQPFMQAFLGGRAVAALTTMLVAVLGVFIIACVNVTNLQLARAAERSREIGVRTALGASRYRIVRQMLVEGLMLSSIGAVIGLVIAQAGTVLFMRAIVDTDPPFWIDVRIDRLVLVAVTALTVIAALAAALVPALRVSRQPVSDVLKDESRSSTSLRIGRLSRGLVIVEIMFSFGLLVVSGMIMKSIVALGTINYPFAVDQTLAGQITIDRKRHPDPASMRLQIDQLRERIAAVPGVRLVAIGTEAPGGGPRFSVSVESEPVSTDPNRPGARRVKITPEYFDALRLPIVQGRAFTEADRDGAPLVAVVTEDFVRRFLPKGGVLGRQIAVGPEKTPQWRTIVGVVPKVGVMLQSTQVGETVFVPLAQGPETGLVIFASTTGDPRALVTPVRHAIAAVDPDLPFFHTMTLREGYDADTWPFRVFGGLFMTFGFGALVLAVAGLYGVMAFSVRRRTPEIGVRMALGADRRRILRMIVSQGLVQVAIGVAGGVLLGRFLASQLTILLFDVVPSDVSVFAVTIAVLVTAGLVATLVPAIRAASVNPIVALRES